MPCGINQSDGVMNAISKRTHSPILISNHKILIDIIVVDYELVDIAGFLNEGTAGWALRWKRRHCSLSPLSLLSLLCLSLLISYLEMGKKRGAAAEREGV